MAARLNPRNQQSVREKIRATQLVNRLENHALGSLKKPMDSTQVTAALGLLKKCVPDISVQTITGDKDKPIVHSIEVTIVDP